MLRTGLQYPVACHYNVRVTWVRSIVTIGKAVLLEPLMLWACIRYLFLSIWQKKKKKEEIFFFTKQGCQPCFQPPQPGGRVDQSLGSLYTILYSRIVLIRLLTGAVQIVIIAYCSLLQAFPSEYEPVWYWVYYLFVIHEQPILVFYKLGTGGFGFSINSETATTRTITRPSLSRS